MLKFFVITIFAINTSLSNARANQTSESSYSQETIVKKVNLQFPKQNYLIEDNFKDFSSNKYLKMDNPYQENEDIYELIGMFVSDYNSKQNIRIKLRMTRDIDFNQASLNWKTSF